MVAENANIFVARLILEELCRHGVRFFVAAPGNRSAPLLWALQRQSGITVLSAYDERSAAFCALGIGKASGTAAAVVTTSGTAVTNMLPAATEAAYDPTPLILLTADRPWELHHQGANQTIEQESVFQSVLRWQGTIPAMEREIDAAAVLQYSSQAAVRSHLPLPGPVHLNCQFRDPLHPVAQEFVVQNTEAFRQWQDATVPWQQWRLPDVDADTLHRKLEGWLSEAVDPLLIVGGIALPHQPAVRQWCRAIGLPLVADISSGVRGSVPTELPYFALVVRQPSIWEWQPDRILWIGGRITSKHLLRWVETRRAPVLRISAAVDEISPGLRQAEHWQVPLQQLNLSAKRFPPGQRPSCYQQLEQSVHKVRQLLQRRPFGEAAVLETLFQQLRAEDVVVCGNSIAIRDADAFVYECSSMPAIIVNRGVSGIDGLIATAVGAAAATQRRTVAVVGDLSALYDLNGLHLLQQVSVPVVVIVLNNQGGQIFSRVIPPRYRSESALFTLPHRYQFAPVAELFGLQYYRCLDGEDFQCHLQAVLGREEKALIEVVLDPSAGLAWYEQVERMVGDAD